MHPHGFIRLAPFVIRCALLFCVGAGLPPQTQAMQKQENPMHVVEDETSITITTANYTIPIIRSGFRYSFVRPDGTTIAPPHADSGIAFTAPYSDTIYSAATTELVAANEIQVHLRVTSVHSDTADVYLLPSEHAVRMRVVPFLPPPPPTPTAEPTLTLTASPSATPTNTPTPTEESTMTPSATPTSTPTPTRTPTATPTPTSTRTPTPPPTATPMTAPPDKSRALGQPRATAPLTPTLEAGFVIDAQLGGIGKGYGLGDQGGASALTIHDDNFTNSAPQDFHRFITNFTVFPAQGFAQVLFWDHQKRVEIGDDISRLGVAGAQQIDGLYYFIGTMPEIYAAYKAAKIEAGYPDAQPKYAMFQPGWEAYGSLGWNTNQQNVTETVQQYLDRGYPLGWAVVGSRTWRGDPDPITAGTTRFGMWDDGSPGSTDTPRYPDPAGFRQFFRDHGLKLLIGMRINMDKENPFYSEAEQQGYFIPGHAPLIDLHNPAALDWYIRGLNLWGVDGFKEDLCCGQAIPYYDAKANPANERLMAQGAYVIVRNSAYAVPGDIIRREDTEYNGYWGPASALTSLAIAYAASGAPNYYPDIVGGTNLQKKELSEQVRRYFIRNATLAAAMPSMSFGFRPWLFDEDVDAFAKRAAEWHSRMAPYIYSAALESFRTGYPHTLTPMMIAYPDDPALYDLETAQWMLGPSLMVVGACYSSYATAGGDECTADVRLPAGVWFDADTGARFEGPTTLEAYPFPLGKIPVFVGGKGVLVEYEPSTSVLTARVYPVAAGGSQYTFTAPDGVGATTITNDNISWDPSRLRVRDITAGATLSYTLDASTGALSFPLEIGHSYRVYTERVQYVPVATTPQRFMTYIPVAGRDS